jgi:hypothetical protein
MRLSFDLHMTESNLGYQTSKFTSWPVGGFIFKRADPLKVVGCGFINEERTEPFSPDQ